MSRKPPRLQTLKPRIASLEPQRHGWQSDERRGSRHERGYGTAWDRLRLLILRRDDYLCQTCASVGRVAAATQVDHKIPKARGGSDSPSNLAAICAPCHRDKTARESRGDAGGIERSNA